VKKIKEIKEKILIIVGPTAVGKSGVAIELAKKLNGEIISADSMQVYKGMNIGTAKLNVDERQGIRHHLIDIVEPSDDFSVARYQKLARAAVSKITGRKKLPILVGGSGLYIRAVTDNLEFPEGKLRSNIRQELEKRAKNNPEFLYDELKKNDPKAAEDIHPNNVRRVIRALEVIKLTGKTFTEYRQEWENRKTIYEANFFGLNLSREKLYVKIDERVDEMFENGFLNEVKKLTLMGKLSSITARQALGYKEVLSYIEGQITLDETKRLIKQRTRNFAKRQLTWFKRDKRIKWIDVEGKELPYIADEIINNLDLAWEKEGKCPNF